MSGDERNPASGFAPVATRRELFAGTGLAATAGLLGAAGGAQAAQPGSASAAAFAELLSSLVEAERLILTPAFDVITEDDRAEGRRFLLHTLLAAVNFWLDADPERPRWQRFIWPHQKLMGDNPDAIYFTAPVRPDRRYVIRGNVAGADYTSFAVEAGTREGGVSTRQAATLNDTEFDIKPDGSYEIQVGGPRQSRNWLALDGDAGTITTRHYYERVRRAGDDPLLSIPLAIDPLTAVPPAPPPSDASVAAAIRRATRFFRFVTINGLYYFRLGPSDRAPDPRASPPFISRVPNRFGPPQQLGANRSEGFSAVDNIYLAAGYDLKPDEALVIRGRFPRARFTNVVLWNPFLQTLGYGQRPVSLNRKQVTLESDGSFRIVLAHRDPGTPNWLDTEGRQKGRIFWRFLLPEEQLQPIETEVIKL